MAATKFLSPGGDGTLDFSFWGAITSAGSSAFTVDQTIKYTGISSLKCAVDSSGNAASIRQFVAADAGFRVTLYLYIQTYASSVLPVITIKNGSTVEILLGLTSTGVLRLYKDQVPTQIGSDGAALSTGKWYRVVLAYVVTSTTVNTINVYVDRVQTIAVTNATLLTSGGTTFSLGQTLNTGLANNAVYNYDSIFCDGGTDSADPGNIVVTAKLPASNNVNTYTTAVGANPANRWTNVNERPLSETNGWTSGGIFTENYGIQAASAGDTGISGGTIVSTQGWLWGKLTGSGGAPTTKLTFNGTDSAITLTTTSAVFRTTVDTATYPGNVATIGQKQTAGAGQTATMYECGVIIAALMPAALTAAVTAAASPAATGTRQFIDSRAVSASVSLVAAAVRSFADNRSATAAVSPAATAARAVVAARSGAAAATPAATAARAFSDARSTTAAVTPAATVAEIAAHPRMASSAVSAAAASSRALALLRSLLAAALPDGTVVRSQGVGRAATSAVPVAALVARATVAGRTIAASVAPAAGGTRATATFRSVAADTAVAGTLARLLDRPRAALASIAAAATLLRGLASARGTQASVNPTGTAAWASSVSRTAATTVGTGAAAVRLFATVRQTSSSAAPGAAVVRQETAARASASTVSVQALLSFSVVKVLIPVRWVLAATPTVQWVITVAPNATWNLEAAPSVRWAVAAEG